MSPVSTPSLDLIHLLRPAELERLRSAFAEPVMAELAETALLRTYPPMEGWTRFFVDRYFCPQTTTWDPARRELVILAILSTTHRGQGAFLAVHLYWALMYLDITEVADTIMLAGTYAGIDVAHAGLGTLRQTLMVLRGVLEDGLNPDPPRIVGTLLARMS